MAGPRDLTTAVLRFGQMLRAAGLPLTVTELMDGVRALEVVDLLDRQDVYLALRTTLVARREEFPAFDRCFDVFWRFQAEEGQGLDGLMSPTEAAIPEEHAGNTGAEAAQKKVSVALEGWEEEGDNDGKPLEVPGVSDREILMDQDFSAFPVEDLDEVARLTILIAKRLALLKEAVPMMSRVTLLFDPATNYKPEVSAQQDAAKALGVQFRPIGTLFVNCFAAAAPTALTATMTSTLLSISSRANLGTSDVVSENR